MLTSEQIRAARALLRWSQSDLAKAADISVETVKRLEKAPGPVSAYTGTMEKITKALERAGAEFIDGDAPGVRLWVRGE